MGAYIKGMFPSTRSLTIFVSLNAFMGILAWFQNIAFQTSFLTFFLFILGRNAGWLFLTEKLTAHRPSIASPAAKPKEEYPYEFEWNVVMSSAMEAITVSGIVSYYSFDTTPLLGNTDFAPLFLKVGNADFAPLFLKVGNTDFAQLFLKVGMFILLSFWFELVFDMGHYWSHRALHHPWIYASFHKKHHKFAHPTNIITFYQDPMDIILTNTIPMTLALSVIPSIDLFQFHLLLIYKNYGEICGHLGKRTYPTSSFCQFIWLPRYWNMELYTEDHDLHHSLGCVNFSKRFSIWDKVFGTFRSKRYY